MQFDKPWVSPFKHDNTHESPKYKTCTFQKLIGPSKLLSTWHTHYYTMSMKFSCTSHFKALRHQWIEIKGLNVNSSFMYIRYLNCQSIGCYVVGKGSWSGVYIDQHFYFVCWNQTWITLYIIFWRSKAFYLDFQIIVCSIVKLKKCTIYCLFTKGFKRQ